MQVGSGDHRYRWIDGWATVPETENGRTHGVATTGDGRVVVFHQADPAVLVFGADGELQDSWGSYPGAHGLTLDAGGDALWLTDQDSAAVHRTTLDGERVASLDPPEHPAYDDGEFVPTWVAPAGDAVWVADGYGESLLHRYEAGGEHVETIDGTGGAGRFDCPHAAWFDERAGELYVADRGNERVQVFDAGGSFERAFGAGVLTSPCSFAPSGDDLVIPELYGRVTVLDADGEPTYLGANEAAVEREDWPNLPRDELEPGRFNSPHDAAVDDDGNVYVVEWIVGGRITKLQRL